uniref:Ig-like domain-containing protein n=1 Tax=Oncorhynchus mykiss TaxID=8022 RepID=A0A8C7SEW7_ONCMY
TNCLCPCLSIVEFEIKVPSEPQLSIVGQHVVLDCTFPVGKVWDLASSVITWERGLEVIHSFYYGQDQLDRQSRHYANRTSLYHSEMKRGNASLMLDHTNLGDKGDYTCSVSTVLGSQKTIPLKLKSTVLYHTNLGFLGCKMLTEILVLTSQGGYPRPLVQWLDDSGDDVTNKTVIHLLEDTHGLYSVFSTLTLQGPVNKTFTFVLKNKDLRQEIRRAITLQRSVEKVERVSEANRKIWTILVPIVTFVLLLFVLLISALRKTCGPVENKCKNIYIYIYI